MPRHHDYERREWTKCPMCDGRVDANDMVTCEVCQQDFCRRCVTPTTHGCDDPLDGLYWEPGEALDDDDDGPWKHARSVEGEP